MGRNRQDTKRVRGKVAISGETNDSALFTQRGGVMAVLSEDEREIQGLKERNKGLADKLRDILISYNLPEMEVAEIKALLKEGEK